jgi:hypothetical protein
MSIFGPLSGAQKLIFEGLATVLAIWVAATCTLGVQLADSGCLLRNPGGLHSELTCKRGLAGQEYFLCFVITLVVGCCSYLKQRSALRNYWLFLQGMLLNEAPTESQPVKDIEELQEPIDL